jgi:hypothetical protein
VKSLFLFHSHWLGQQWFASVHFCPLKNPSTVFFTTQPESNVHVFFIKCSVLDKFNDQYAAGMYKL